MRRRRTMNRLAGIGLTSIDRITKLVRQHFARQRGYVSPFDEEDERIVVDEGFEETGERHDRGSRREPRDGAVNKTGGSIRSKTFNGCPMSEDTLRRLRAASAATAYSLDVYCYQKGIMKEKPREYLRAFFDPK